MTFQFLIQLMDVTDPPVWRRVLVLVHFNFFRFHLVIQEAFGWEQAHLFQFSPKGWGSKPVIVLKMEDSDPHAQDCHAITLAQVFKKTGQTYTYLYDFSDDWQHAILLENISEANLQRADVVEGEGKCPPEDCGGFPGYEQLKEVLADPTHPEHRDMKSWLGMTPKSKWNAAAFNLKKAQAAVRRV